jgi:hypothetical protein
MNRETYQAMFDELEKISSDLMTPAVVSDSATVNGPPATPFTRRRGYRKLESSGSVKEARALLDYAKAGGLRLVRKAKRVGWALKKMPGSPGPAAGVLYHEVPSPLRRVAETVLGDPASVPAPNPITRIFGG